MASNLAFYPTLNVISNLVVTNTSARGPGVLNTQGRSNGAQKPQDCTLGTILRIEYQERYRRDLGHPEAASQDVSHLAADILECS